MAGWMLCGLTALAGGRLCQKVKSAFMRIRYLRPRAEVCGNTRFSRGGGKTVCRP